MADLCGGGGEAGRRGGVGGGGRMSVGQGGGRGRRGASVDLQPGGDPGIDLRQRLRRLNPGAALHVSVLGDIAPDLLFGAGLFDPERSPDVRRWLRGDAYATHAHPYAHAHDAAIAAFCLTFDRPLDWDTVQGRLARLRRDRGEGLLRVKGVLDLAGEAAPVAIHGVHHVFHPPVLLAGWPDAERTSRIVFITRGVSRADIEAGMAGVAA